MNKQEIKEFAENCLKYNKYPIYISDKETLSIFVGMGFEQTNSRNIDDLTSGLLANKIVYEPLSDDYLIPNIDSAFSARCLYI